MKSVNSCGVIQGSSTQASLVIVLILVGVFSFSCRTPAAPPPPPPPPAPVEEPPPPPPPSITLTARPSSIERGEETTLEWQAQNAESVRIEPGIGSLGTAGRRDVSPSSSVTYTATATGPGGTSTDTVRVSVTVPDPPPPPPPLPSTPEPTIEELFQMNVHPILFDYDKAEIRPDQVGLLQQDIRFLQENQNIRFTISGHADERGSQEYNIGLGDLRANAVRQFLVEQGITESRINTVSFGEERPVCTTITESCYQQNRRAEFVMRQ